MTYAEAIVKMATFIRSQPEGAGMLTAFDVAPILCILFDKDQEAVVMDLVFAKVPSLESLPPPS